jgi:hypothetical protein
VDIIECLQLPEHYAIRRAESNFACAIAPANAILKICIEQFAVS